MTAQEFTTISLARQYAEFIACGLMTRAQAMEWLSGVGICSKLLDTVEISYANKNFEHG